MDLLKKLVLFMLKSAITVCCFLGFAEEEAEVVEPSTIEEAVVEQTDEANSQEDEQSNSDQPIETDTEVDEEPVVEPVIKKPWKRLPSKPLPVGSNVELPQDI